jgi:threonine/homoserine/homoserine lactone efflux protein
MLTMVEVIALGFMVGLSGVTFPGPVFIFIVQQSLANGFRSGLLAMLAHALVGLMILLLIMLTDTTTLFQLAGFQFYNGVIGGLSLMVLGILILRNFTVRNRDIKLNKGDAGYSRPFLGGLVVSVSNPQFFVWWAVIGLPSVSIADDLFGMTGIYGWTIGILLSLFLWYGGVSFIASRGSCHVSKRVILVISFICGTTLMISGFYLLAKYLLKLI